MSGLPAMLMMEGRRALVVGGGAVAARRATALAAAGAAVRVVAIEMGEAMQAAASEHGAIELVQRRFETDDCEGAFVVVVATDEAAANERVAVAAREAGALVNRADEPAAGDFVVPAHRRRGPVTVSVSTGGASAAAGRTLVERCAAGVDEAWVTLLEVAGAMRPIAQRRIADPAARQAALRAMTDEAAMSALRAEGEAGLRAYMERIISDAE